MAEGLTTQTLRGARWSYLSTFVTAGLQIFVMAILARIVAPEAFGLVAMAGLALRFGQYFAQMGVGQAIVQRKELTEDHIRAGFWASVVVGAAVSGVVWVAAPLVAVAFDSPDLSTVVRIMGLSFFFTGTATTALALLRRNMRFQGIALADIMAYVVGYAIVGVVLAMRGAGLWSLVAAALCQAVLATIAYNIIARPATRPLFTWRTYRELLGFGSAVSVISFLEFLNGSLDTMVVGRLAGPTMLGFYSRALNLTALPLQYMSTSLSRVLFPSFSRAQADPVRLRSAYLKVITVFAGVGLPIAFGMSGAAREIVLVALGPKWMEAIPVMRIVALASAVSMLSHFGGITLEATARLREKFVMRLGQLAFFAAALLTLGRYGLVGYALAFTLSEVGFHLIQAAKVATLLGIPRPDLIRAYVPGVVGGVLAWISLAAESFLGNELGLPAPAVLTVEVFTGLLVLAFVVLRAGRGAVFVALERVMDQVRPPALRRALYRVAWSPAGPPPAQGVLP